VKTLGAERLIVAGLLGLTALVGSSEGAGGEIALFTGPAFATYKQSFTFDKGSPQIGLARLNVKDSPSLEADGGLSFGASATFFIAGPLGIEARIDSVDVDLQSFGGNYTLELGPPGTPVSTLPVTLGAGDTNLRRVKPLSLNLRLQSQGRVGIGISGGISYLSKVDLDAFPTVSVANLNATIPVSLSASPANPDETRHLGFNGGITLQVKIARGFSVVAEARGFAFRRSEFKWTSSSTAGLTAIETAIVAGIASQLEIPEYTPGFWAARAGIAFRF